MSTVRLFLLVCFVSFPVCKIKASNGKLGVGIGLQYNYQTKGFGAGLRADYLLLERLHVVPQLVYFPPNNIVHEILAGAAVAYDLVWWKKFTGYLLLDGFADFWINAETSPYKKAKPVNFVGEAGAGIVYGDGCYKPFIEHRYNPIWLEGTTHIGILWYPGCGNNKRHLCPAYS